MTYIVNDKCINCRHTDCVEVCPVDCFYLGENTIVIHPDECIDCGVCEPECPVDAIKPDTEDGANKWVEHNTEYSNVWSNISKARPEDVPKDQERWRGVENKIKYFSEKPGKGD